MASLIEEKLCNPNTNLGVVGMSNDGSTTSVLRRPIKESLENICLRSRLLPVTLGKNCNRNCCCSLLLPVPDPSCCCVDRIVPVM